MRKFSIETLGLMDRNKGIPNGYIITQVSTFDTIMNIKSMINQNIEISPNLIAKSK